MTKLIEKYLQKKYYNYNELKYYTTLKIITF